MGDFLSQKFAKKWERFYLFIFYNVICNSKLVMFYLTSSKNVFFMTFLFHDLSIKKFSKEKIDKNIKKTLNTFFLM